MPGVEEKKAANLKFSDSYAVTLDGIELPGGERVLPGLSNSFAVRRNISFWARHRSTLWFSGLLVLMLLSVLLSIFRPWGDSDEYGEIPFATFAMDVAPLQRKPTGPPILEIDEIFGNEFIKDKDKVAENGEDPRVGSAINALASGLAPPVDLTPDLQPDYPASARSRGVEGIVYLEMVIADDGTTLRVRVAKSLDPELDQSAASAFRRKRFAPARGPDGKGVTVKFIQPVRFRLTQ